MSHPLTLTSPLLPEHLMLESVVVTAGLSTLGDMQLGLVSERHDLDSDGLLGRPVTVTMRLRDDFTRHFHGYVTRFGIGARRGRHFGYQAVVRPWPWFLTRTSDCRIFQGKTVPEIVADVFHDHSIANFELKTFRTYRRWAYCVQYRESDFNFVARLLEHEGIYWYFEHSDGQHKLVLVDSQSAHDAAPDCARLPYCEGGGGAAPYLEHVSSWSFSREVKPGKVVLTSYDFERPSTDLAVDAAKQNGHDLADYEVFDFQGDYAQAGDASQWAENRLDEIHAAQQQLRGATNAQGLQTGCLFNLHRHPRDDQNIEYLVTGLTLSAQASPYESGTGGDAFHCSFRAIPSTQQFRPRRQTPKPSVKGPQTAVVVGPPGEEIHTDEHGRVKVHFHWDRNGPRDEKASCWIRVSQPWAGKGWGAVSIPRIGQEVIVDFLEGDPDQPIITGRVYNAEQGPPFALPGSGVVSGIKSNTHKGSGYNEMSMDDTAGQEKITIHGQYDMATAVEHDQTNTINNNRSTTVVVDDTLNVNANRTVHVQGKLSETIDTGREVTVSAGHTETITGGATSTVTGGFTSTVNGAWGNTINGRLTETITSGEEQTVSAGKTLTVTGGGFTEDVTGTRTITVTGPMSQTATATLDLHADGAATYTSVASLTLAVAGSGIEITPAAITISSGESTIKVDASGVSVNGVKISLNC